LRAAFQRTQNAAAILRNANVLFLAALVLLSPEYPWYYLILVPFTALLRNGPIWVPTLAPTWAMSIGALLLTAATTSNAHATLIVKSILFGSALSCWAWSAWSRRKRPLMVQ
jgi:alpha-1,6-mannosyltransferase